MSDYPRIGTPRRQPGGTYTVTVKRAPGDSREISYPGKGEAMRGVQALRMAQEILTPEKGPPVKITGISGPSRNGAKWTLRWFEGDGDEAVKRSRTGPLEAMRELKRELTDTKASRGPKLPRRAKFGTPAYFKQSIADALEANRVATIALDHEAIKATKARISVLRESVQAATPFLEHEQVQAALEKVVDYLEKHEHITKVEGAEDLQPASPELAEALSGVAGPWESLGGHGPAIQDQGRGTRGESN